VKEAAVSPDDTTPLKKCIDCGRELPRTAEYFHRNAGNKDGLYGHCKACGHDRYRARTSAKERRFLMRDGRKLCGHCNQEFPATTDYFYPNNTGSGGLSSECRECRKQLGRKYYEANRQKVLGGEKRRRTEHKDEARIRRAKKYAANPEQARERTREWKLENPERNRANVRNRRARLRNAVGTVTAKDIHLQYKAQGGRCWWCGCELHNAYHVDHRIPLIVSNDNSPGNICLTCPTCNLRKNAKMPWEFNGRLL
jgi:hypothetical protein